MLVTIVAAFALISFLALTTQTAAACARSRK
jgi:hypothetical protein